MSEHAIVTGASSGIGLAIARKLVNRDSDAISVGVHGKIEFRITENSMGRQRVG